jgi:hypothetical protein
MIYNGMSDEEKVEVQIVLKNHFGEFVGKKSTLNEEQYKNLLQMSKSFYVGTGFELTCEDGTFVVFPPEIVRQSILQVKKIKNEENV